MTEAEWNACTDPQPMLEFLRGERQLTHRELRLFCVACCRRILPMMDEICRRAVEVAERYADGNATFEDLSEAHDGIRIKAGSKRAQLTPEQVWNDGIARSTREAVEGTTRPAKAVPGKVIQSVSLGGMTVPDAIPFTYVDLPALAGILRDIASNPFRTAAPDPIWLAAPVTSLAQAIYNDHAFDRMPILADALEDAGCHDAEILAHCRNGGEHVRGCWVVDLLTGRE